MERGSAENTTSWEFVAMQKFPKIEYKEIYILKAYELGYSIISFVF